MSHRGQPGSLPHPTPFVSRELPSSSPAYRTGSSMSISSMLGSDSDRPDRDPGPVFSRPPASSTMFGSAPPLSAPAAMSPPSAPSRPASYEHPLFQRSRTPERLFPKDPPGRVYRSSSGGILQGSLADHPRFGSLPRAPPSSQFPETRSPRISSAEAPYNESRRLSLNGPITRPNSQPQHMEPPVRTPGYGPIPLTSQGVVEAPFGATQRSSSFMDLEKQYGRPNALFGDRQAEEQAFRERERALARETELRPPRSQSHFRPHYADRDATDRLSTASTWELGRTHPPSSPEPRRVSVTEPGSGFGFGAIQNYAKPIGSQLGGPRQTPHSVQHRQDSSTSPHNEQSYLSNLQSQPRLLSASSVPAVDQPSFGISMNDDHRHKGSDELLQKRSLLGIDSKRGGRASPIPQAVQGAQAPINGPVGESGMKGELGRVFSGIGSGVGGVTASTVSRASTPMASSPFKRESLTGRSMLSDIATDDNGMIRPGSTIGKRPRRSREDEGSQVESESARDAWFGTSARARRGRHLHHHHHHHQYVYFCGILLVLLRY